MSITQGSEAKLIQNSIQRNMEITELLRKPENKVLLEVMDCLKAENKQLRDKIESIHTASDLARRFG